jgi:hypothetical protein
VKAIADFLVMLCPHPRTVGLILVSFLYLTIDLYQQVASLKAIWSTVSFWMLWLVFSFLDLLAFDLLYSQSHQRMDALNLSPVMEVAAMQFLATIGAYSILQSFTVQFAGRKVVDIQELVTRFRSKTLQMAAARLSSQTRENSRRLAARLRDVYKNDLLALNEDYSQIMTLAKMPRERILSDLAEYEGGEGTVREVFLSDLVMRMAIADPENSRGLLLRRRLHESTSR